MAHKQLITLGMKCPRPLFEVHKAMKDMEAGETLEVVADDPAFRPDIEAWCRRTGHDLVDLQSDGDKLTAIVRRPLDGEG